MSNKQQTEVKLYTEEQLLNTADAIRNYLKNYPEKFHESMIEKHFKNLTPIKLPSDEELRKEFDIDKFDPYDLAYLGGAIRMRNKIQGGNNEQR
jgi:hypothetical protein